MFKQLALGLVPSLVLVAGCQPGTVVDGNDDDDDVRRVDATPGAVADSAPTAGPDARPGSPDATPSNVDAMASAPDATSGSPLLPNWCDYQDDRFSFFVTSMSALWALSGSSSPGSDGYISGGFGGDFGGIAGADELCQTIAIATGHGDRTWHAFLSATDDGSGSPVDAIDRIGDGPWYDANGRTVATGVAGLVADDRPDGERSSTDDLPDECGVPLTVIGDVHDVLTGSDRSGRLADSDPYFTCSDWTSSSGAIGEGAMVGHSFPRNNFSGRSWVSDHGIRGCAKGANLSNDGPGSGDCVGCNGGFGAIYCFAL